jgi:hypothetical protein
MNTIFKNALMLSGFVCGVGGGFLMAQDPKAPAAGPIAQPPPAPDAGNQTTGVLLTSAGLIALLSGMATKFWEDRKDARVARMELAKYDRLASNSAAIRQLWRYVGTLSTKVPNAPPIPEIPAGLDSGEHGAHSV